MFYLLKEKRFAPFFWTQFLGAFNDNVFKNALIILITYQISKESESGTLVSMAGGLFILPFIIFSAIAGQISDKFEKSSFIVFTKKLETIIMLIAALGFWLNNIYFLLFVLFAMGTQSAIFGPVKYSLIPQVLKTEAELVAGTSLVEMGTFLAIVLGTILGGVLINFSLISVSIAVIIFSLLGWLSACFIPKLNAQNPNLKIKYQPIAQYKSMLKVSYKNPTVFYSILAISWFWFFGACYLTQIPVYSKFILNADKEVVTAILSTFVFSMAVGSIICNLLSQKRIELGLVFIGAIGLSLFSWDLSQINIVHLASNDIFSLRSILDPAYRSQAIRIYLDFFLVGCFGSLYIVPLYALLQNRSSEKTCSQVIACNNVINSIFMVLSAIFIIILYQNQFNTAQIFSVLAYLNIIFTVFISMCMPEILARFIVWLKINTFYNLEVKGKISRNIILIYDSLSIIDWFYLCFILQSPVRRIMKNKRGKVLYDLLCPAWSWFKIEDFKNPNAAKFHLQKNSALCISKNDFNEILQNNPDFKQLYVELEFSVANISKTINSTQENILKLNKKNVLWNLKVYN